MPTPPSYTIRYLFPIVKRSKYPISAAFIQLHPIIKKLYTQYFMPKNIYVLFSVSLKTKYTFQNTVQYSFHDTITVSRAFLLIHPASAYQQKRQSSIAVKSNHSYLS